MDEALPQPQAAPAPATPVEAAAANGSGYLTREGVQQVRDLVEEDVEVKEWGGKVRLRSLTREAYERVRGQSLDGSEVDPDRFELLLFIHGVIEPQFTESDIPWLREKNASVITRITTKLMGTSVPTTKAVEVADKTFRAES